MALFQKDLKKILNLLIDNDTVLTYLKTENWTGVSSVIVEVVKDFGYLTVTGHISKYDVTQSLILLCWKSGISTQGYFGDHIPQNYFENLITIDELKKSVEAPSYIKTILMQGFRHTPFNKVILNEGLEYIGDYVFSNCYNLVEMILPKSLYHLGDNAFDSCELLVDVTIPNTIKEIGDNIFSKCINLQTITFTGTQKEAIESGFFTYDVIGLKKRVQIKCTDGDLTYEGK